MQTNTLINQQFGKCRVERLLNRGGYGYSFIGWDEGIEKNRVVKISKVPVDSTQWEENEIDNFRREGIILSRLKHPQIVTLIEQGEDHGYYYMILDYIEGFDFNNVIRVLKEKQKELGCQWVELMDPLTAIAIVLSALEPLSYAHGAKIKMPGQDDVVEGLAHRDISPGNMMLGSGHEYEGMVHLIDFGIAKANIHQSKTMNTAIIGSATYLSPMRLMKKGMGEGRGPFWKNFQQTQHDVHAMGVILYELLSGRKFVEAEDLPGAIAQIQTSLIYESLYTNIMIFDEGIRDVIKKSVVFPDIKKNKGPYQFKNASEMKYALQMVYNNLAGGAPIKDVLSHFSKEISEPEKLLPSKDASSRVAMYSKSKKVSTGFVKSSRESTKWPMLALIGLIVGGFVFWFGRSVPRNSGETIKEKQVNLKNMEEKSLRESALSRKIQKTIIKRQKIDEVSKIKSSENAIDSIKKGIILKERKIERVKTGEDRGLLVKRPAHSKVMKSRGNKSTKESIPKKDGLVKRTSDVYREKLKAIYTEIRSKIQSGDKQGAFVLVKSAMEKYNDPAFMLLKAYLIHERNPVSKEKERLVKESEGKKSLVMTDKELEKMKARMR